jgi:hypothetical protein
LIHELPPPPLQTSAQQEEVRIAHAEYLFAQGDMVKAAKRYAETAYSFEEVRA